MIPPTHGFLLVFRLQYDSFHWMEKFGDTDFAHHSAMAKFVGAITLRLADDRILPREPASISVPLASR